MKIKEALSNEFKIGDENMDVKQKELKRDGDLILLEIVKRENDLPYSEYGLYDNGVNLMYIKIYIPDPREKDSYKDVFLKYQNGVKVFMEDLFDVLVGDKEDFKQIYTCKQKKDLIYKQDDNGIVYITLKEDKDYVFGFVDFISKFGSITFSKDINLKIAENFVKYFEGIPIEEKWGELCEQ